MKTVQMTVDEPLLGEVDRVVEQLHSTRSAFIRHALQLALQQYEIEEMEKRHAEGYTRHPVKPGEFDVWQTEQSWGEP